VRVPDPDLVEWVAHGRLVRYRIFSASELIAFIDMELPRIDGHMRRQIPGLDTVSVLRQYKAMIERLAPEVQRCRVYGSGSSKEKAALWTKAKAIYGRYHEICEMLS
jgi:hypothetical protein